MESRRLGLPSSHAKPTSDRISSASGVSRKARPKRSSPPSFKKKDIRHRQSSISCRASMLWPGIARIRTRGWSLKEREQNCSRRCADPASTLRLRSEEHTSELQSLMRISYAVFCLKKQNRRPNQHDTTKQDDTRQLADTIEH